MLRDPAPPPPPADQLALQVLAWTLADEARARRLLDTTGLEADELRARIGEPALLAACLGFVEAYEPDLVAAADAVGQPPAAIVAARRALEAA